MNMNTSSCTDCPEGKYGIQYYDMIWGVVSTCIDCPEGRSTNGQTGQTDETACSSCVTGKYENQQGTCTDCAAGKYSDQQGGCTGCGNQYQNEAGQSSCKDCTEGKVAHQNKLECIEITKEWLEAEYKKIVTC